jgi:hypothetical protein
MLRLNRFVFGGTKPVQNVFPIDIARDKTIRDLKESIKAKKQ